MNVTVTVFKSVPKTVAGFIGAFTESLEKEIFSHLALNHYQGKEPALKKIIIRRILIKGQENLSFTYRYQTRDIVKNHPVKEGINIIGNFLHDEWNHAILYTLQNDLVFQRQGKIIHLNKAPASTKELPTITHDKPKQRLIKAEDASYLQELKLADGNGKIYQNAQDKYRQINKFIEIFAGLLKDSGLDENIRVLDMGSGKGYLTFALYDYLANTMGLNPEVIGIEYRQDMVDLCNGIAQKVRFEKLGFVQSAIKDYPIDDLDVLIALHACDTATDEALASGIKAGAKIILCSPCCHKQIRREMEKNKPKNDMNFLTRFGTFQERHAEMVTDGLRALILEYFGYKTNAFEFISDAHTPKNIMITAVKTTITDERKQEILNELQQAKAYFGITTHHLETLVSFEN